MSKTTAADGLLDEMERESGKAIAELSTPRTRRKPMMWNKLGEGKDPEFNKQYFLTVDFKWFWVGILHSITNTATGKEYSWKQSSETDLATDMVYYCEPQIP